MNHCSVVASVGWGSIDGGRRRISVIIECFLLSRSESIRCADWRLDSVIDDFTSYAREMRRDDQTLSSVQPWTGRQNKRAIKFEIIDPKPLLLLVNHKSRRGQSSERRETKESGPRRRVPSIRGSHAPCFLRLAAPATLPTATEQRGSNQQPAAEFSLEKVVLSSSFCRPLPLLFDLCFLSFHRREFIDSNLSLQIRDSTLRSPLAPPLGVVVVVVVV